MSDLFCVECDRKLALLQDDICGFCAEKLQARIAELEAENVEIRAEIAQLQADNRSLVEQMNQIAMRIEHKSGTAQRIKS